jgi:hypothetical protein
MRIFGRSLAFKFVASAKQNIKTYKYLFHGPNYFLIYQQFGGRALQADV